jgi:hypothetical protein
VSRRRRSKRRVNRKVAATRSSAPTWWHRLQA